MALEKDVWVLYIMGNLFKNNEFMEKSFVVDKDSGVISGKVVHIPQAGAKPQVVKNRSTYPATAVRRTDEDIVYLIDEYTTNPTHIPNIEIVQESEAKMESVLGEHIAALRDTIGDDMLYLWQAASTYSGSRSISAAPVIRTSGGSVTAHLPSASGNRKLIVKEDLQKARTLLNKQNVLQTDRYALFSSDMLDQLMSDSDLKKRYALELDMRSGSIGRLYGFEILERSTTSVYNNASTPVIKAVGATPAETDNDSVICWQKFAVECAIGDIDVFESVDDPLYYGNVYSALIRMGGRKRRASAEGIVAIVQDEA